MLNAKTECKARRAWAVAAVVVAMVAIGFWRIHPLRPREPVFQGKRLTEWLEQYTTNTLWAIRKPRPELVQEAQTAIRQIGTNALPICFDLMKSRESRLKVKLLGTVPVHWLMLLHAAQLSEYQDNIASRQIAGVYGFQALGEEAKPAVPALIRMMRDKDMDRRRSAMDALWFMGPVASEAVPELIRSLEDPDLGIRVSAAQALGDIGQAPEQVVPALLEILEGYRTEAASKAFVAARAAESLGKFGAQAKEAVPVLRALLNDKNGLVRSAATNALRKINPEAAAASKRGTK
jgi:HEAT repeat protein